MNSEYFVLMQRFGSRHHGDGAPTFTISHPVNSLPGPAERAFVPRGATLLVMLTRAGVARRLGKSIATIRRMEGVELHPRVDARGVHWLELREVDAAAVSARRGTQHRIGLNASDCAAPQGPCDRAERNFDSTPESDEEDSGGVNMAEARAWAAQARHDAMAIREERNRLEGLRRQELAAADGAARELNAAKRMLIAELEDCDDWVLRRLADADLAEILALLETD